jgi:hypothetical protein
MTASAGRRSAPSSSSTTCPYVSSVIASEWPASRAISTTERPSAIRKEQNAWRRSYGRAESRPTDSGERSEDAATPVAPVVVSPRRSVAAREDPRLPTGAPACQSRFGEIRRECRQKLHSARLPRVCLGDAPEGDRALDRASRRAHLARRDRPDGAARPLSAKASAPADDPRGNDRPRRWKHPPTRRCRVFPLSQLAPLAGFGVHAASAGVHRGRCPAPSSSSRLIVCSRPSRVRWP